MPIDRVHQNFFARQYAEAMALCAQSDVVALEALDAAAAPQRYLVTLGCTGLRRTASGEIAAMRLAHVLIHLPDDYLRRVDGPILSWLDPPDVFHPNIQPPFVCLGHLPPGTTLTAICHQLLELASYQRYAPHDALNADAAAWARHHQHLFPTDRRPLKRRVPAPAVVSRDPKELTR